MAASVPFLDLTAQYESIKGDLDRAVARVVESQRFVLGPEVESLERELADYIGVDHAVGCASGTDALLLPLQALQSKRSAEVVVPAFTFFATAGAVWNAGMRPVFCDVDPNTFNVTADTVSEAITDRTVAVVVVHLFGQMAPMRELLALAEDRGLILIEDAAQAIGARQSLEGLPGPAKAGSLGWAGTFSFFPTKNLGAFGEGGLITTDDPELAERVAKARVHGGQQMYHHDFIGTNSRLHALQAAVLRAKLPYLDGWATKRRDNAARYDALLADIPEVIPPCAAAGNYHVYNQYTLRTRRRDELRAHLARQGIGTGVYYPVPLHLQSCFRELGMKPGSLPVSEALSGEVLSLPVYPELPDAQLQAVADGIAAFYGH